MHACMCQEKPHLPGYGYVYGEMIQLPNTQHPVPKTRSYRMGASSPRRIFASVTAALPG